MSGTCPSRQDGHGAGRSIARRAEFVRAFPPSEIIAAVKGELLVSRGRLLLRMELRSNPEVLCVVRSAVTWLAELLGFSDSDSHLVILALDEALTNIIRHAYLGVSANDPSR
jgi:hypothetical protein